MMLVHVTVSTLKSHAIALLAKCETAVRIQDEDVVFLMRQGHEFLLLSGSGPNPPVWQFLEGSSELKQLAPTFTEFVVEELQAT